MDVRCAPPCKRNGGSGKSLSADVQRCFLQMVTTKATSQYPWHFDYYGKGNTGGRSGHHVKQLSGPEAQSSTGHGPGAQSTHHSVSQATRGKSPTTSARCFDSARQLKTLSSWTYWSKQGTDVDAVNPSLLLDLWLRSPIGQFRLPGNGPQRKHRPCTPLLRWNGYPSVQQVLHGTCTTANGISNFTACRARRGPRRELTTSCIYRKRRNQVCSLPN